MYLCIYVFMYLCIYVFTIYLLNIKNPIPEPKSNVKYAQDVFLFKNIII